MLFDASLFCKTNILVLENNCCTNYLINKVKFYFPLFKILPVL